MLTCNRLRIDPGDSSPIVDYRIENGRVECRMLYGPEGDHQWRLLMPEELSSHVISAEVRTHLDNHIEGLATKNFGLDGA